LFNPILTCVKVGGSTKIVITQQAGNSAKGIKIQPKPDPGINPALPVVTVPKINKGKFSGGKICISIYHKCAVFKFYGPDTKE